MESSCHHQQNEVYASPVWPPLFFGLDISEAHSEPGFNHAKDGGGRDYSSAKISQAISPSIPPFIHPSIQSILEIAKGKY